MLDRLPEHQPVYYNCRYERYMLDLCYTEKSEKNAYIIDITDRIYVNTPELSEAD